MLFQDQKIKSFFIIYQVRANRFTVWFFLSFQPSRKYFKPKDKNRLEKNV